MALKLKKVKKSVRMRGKGMGTHGWGARKKHMGSGHRGGFGMAGTGKRADHKKSLVIKKFKKYFGKQGFTSMGTERKKADVMNIEFIEKNLASIEKKFKNKEGVIDLKGYKILGKGEMKSKLTIKAQAVSATAKEKIEKAGGKVILPVYNEVARPKSAGKNDKAEDEVKTKEDKLESKEMAPKGVPADAGTRTSEEVPSEEGKA